MGQDNLLDILRHIERSCFRGLGSLTQHQELGDQLRKAIADLEQQDETE